MIHHINLFLIIFSNQYSVLLSTHFFLVIIGMILGANTNLYEDFSVVILTAIFFNTEAAAICLSFHIYTSMKDESNETDRQVVYKTNS